MGKGGQTSSFFTGRHFLGLGDAVIQIQIFAISDTRTPANATTLTHEINCEFDSSGNQIFLGGSRWGACRSSPGLYPTAVCGVL
jgi:hypothetical protein